MRRTKGFWIGSKFCFQIRLRKKKKKRKKRKHF